MTKLTNLYIEEMKFDEIVEYVEDLLAIKTGDYALESTKFLPIFTNLSRFNRLHVKKYMKLVNQKDSLFIKKQKIYGNKMGPEYYAKHPMPVFPALKDVDKWVKADQSIIEIEELCKEQELIVKLIEDAMKQSSTRGFAIKASIDYLRLVADGK